MISGRAGKFAGEKIVSNTPHSQEHTYTSSLTHIHIALSFDGSSPVSWQNAHNTRLNNFPRGFSFKKMIEIIVIICLKIY